VTTGVVRRAKLQSGRHHQKTNTQFFHRPDALMEVDGVLEASASARGSLEAVF